MTVRLVVSVAALLVAFGAPAPGPARADIQRIWLTHRSGTPDRVVVNWQTDAAGDSVVSYRSLRTGRERTVRVDEKATLHHVEIAIETGGGPYRYRVSTGAERSPEATFKGYPADRLRAAVVANWHGKAQLDALAKDDVDLLMTAGDNVENLHQLCGAGVADCTKPYAALIEAYPQLFRSVPFMPVLGNHDREIRPRGDQPPRDAVYDTEAHAFRTFFELPGDEWKWVFDFPGLDVRFVALDLNHISDFGTTWQTCHDHRAGSAQLAWYGELMSRGRRRFVVTLYNENNSRVRKEAASAWGRRIGRGTIVVSGFGHFAERAEADGVSYYNMSLKGTGTKVPDPASKVFFSEDNYLLLTFARGARTMTAELKGVDGRVLDRVQHRPGVAVAGPAAPPFTVAHRALCGRGGENTLPAIAACLERGIGVEFDVRRSKDGALVALHDETLERTTSGRGRVGDFTLSELRKLEALGSRATPSAEAARIPLVGEIFAMLARHPEPRTLVTVDLKASDPALEADVVRLAREHGVQDRLLYIGRAISESVVRSRLRRADRAAHVAALASTPAELAASLADRNSDWAYLRFVPRPLTSRASAARESAPSSRGPPSSLGRPTIGAARLPRAWTASSRTFPWTSRPWRPTRRLRGNAPKKRVPERGDLACVPRKDRFTRGPGEVSPMFAESAKAVRASWSIALLVCSACGNGDVGSDSASGAPSGLTATPLGGGVHLTWKDNTNDEESFEIERKGDGDFALLESVAFGTVQYHDSDVSAGKTYVYRVRAKTPAGYTAYSNQAKVSLPGGAGGGAGAGGSGSGAGGTTGAGGASGAGGRGGSGGGAGGTAGAGGTGGATAPRDGGVAPSGDARPGTPIDAGTPPRVDAAPAGPVSFRRDVVPTLVNGCGAFATGCHERDQAVGRSGSPYLCKVAWLSTEDASLGALFYSGTNAGKPTGCPDLSLYDRLLQVTSMLCGTGGAANRPRYVVPGNLGRSLLYQVIAGDPSMGGICQNAGMPVARMPKAPSPPISPTAIKAIADWISQGAPNN